MKGPLNFKNCVMHFECHQNWHNLEITEDVKVKFCTECKKNVYVVKEVDEYESAIREGKCVAIFKDKLLLPTMGVPSRYDQFDNDDPDLPF